MRQMSLSVSEEGIDAGSLGTGPAVNGLWRPWCYLYTDGGNSGPGKQGGKEKDRGHDGDETSKSKGMFAMSFHLLEGGISKREVSGFWARGEDDRDETREWLSWAVHESQ